MIRTEAEKLVVDTLREYVGIYDLDLTTSLSYLKLDSLDVVKICTILEEKTFLTIEPPKNLRDIKTVSDIVRLVEAL